MSDTTEGAGWVVFAGIMILIAAVLNCIWGIAAIDKASFFVEDQRFIISDLSTWGWIVLIIGVLQLFAAFSIWSGGAYGRWIGIITAGLGSISALLSIPGFPSGRFACSSSACWWSTRSPSTVVSPAPDPGPAAPGADVSFTLIG